MTTRREFLNRTLLGSAAFGAGLLGGWMPFRGGLPQASWSLAARVPAGGEAGLEALARRLGLDLSRGEWVPLADGDSADLALLYDGRLLDPAEWPAVALDLRAGWSGHPARRWLRLAEDGRRAAGRAVVRGADGVLATLDLDREGDRVFMGRNGHRLVLSSRDGGVAVVEAGCRHQHCLRQGRVSLSGERLVCAPAGLLVSLEV
ncbi:MAG TPA: NusG domain II-containing protein [Vicinamibacterales bacterium]|nr:NusG domain II-containing protein [Vicinamibacterales bacterium]